MRRGITAVVFLVFVAVTALWWVFLASGQNAAVADVEAEIQAEKDTEDSLRRQIGALNEIQDQEVSYQFAINQMEGSIPEFPEIDTFLEELNYLAFRTGVDLAQIGFANPSDPGEEGGALEINVSLSGVGQYFEVLGFLYGLEAMERIVRVDTIGLTPSAGEGSDGEEGPEDPDAPQPDLGQGPTPRPDTTNLTIQISAVIFTRTPGVVTGETGDGTTTTTTLPDEGEDTTTTTEGEGE